MNTQQKGIRHNHGMALITALVFTVIMVLILTSVTTRYVQQRVHVDRFEDYYLSFEGAEAAMQLCKSDVEDGGDGIIGLEGWDPVYDDNNTLILPDLESSDSEAPAQAVMPGIGLAGTFVNWFSGQTAGTVIRPMTLDSMPGVSFIGYTVRWFGNGRDMNGDGLADSEAERNMFTIYTASRSEAALRQVEAVYASYNVNVWRNAVFAGAGQSGRLINGNVSIHGSVHLLGDNLPDGGLAIDAVEYQDPVLELGGTSLIANNYAGMPASLATRIPPLPTRLYHDEEVSSLFATLRVKHGLVSLNGSAHIGLDQVEGSNVKNPMDGTYVSEGWAGNQVEDGVPGRVWSDNGFDAPYDLGDRVSMPMLADDWREPDGTRVMNPHTGSWYTHEEYFTEVLLADPALQSDGIYTGNIEIHARNSPHHYWNATTQEELTGPDALAATPDPTDDFMHYNADTKTLSVNGTIRINGDLRFRQQGSDYTIHYTGRAALLVDGDVSLDANLLACNNGNPNDTANSFPANNVLGIMATGDMAVGASSQLQLMGAFYAQGKITAEKQTTVLGTFVANYFDMGGQVPRIYQVPALADHLPYGMIGNFPIMVLQQTSWRELGVA